MPRRSLSMTGVVAALACSPAVAHHSFAMFDQAKQETITGTVKEFQFNNPHCFIQLLVPQGSGAPAEWSIEMGPPAHLISDGWTRNTIHPGDKINVTFHPLKEGANGGSFVSATDAAGKKL